MLLCKGIKATFDNLHNCIPKGIPIIVIKGSKDKNEVNIDIIKPPNNSQIIFIIHPRLDLFSFL